jgi:hypothetical protein
MRLLTIENIKLFDKNKNIKYEQSNIKNTLHQIGESYMLNCLFVNKTRKDKGEIQKTREDFYYAGLDNRSTLNTTDVMSSLVNEPSANGYSRQKITSWSSPVISNSVFVTKSNNITFNASTGTNTGWGPVKNIFLATTQNISGILISSAKLNQELKMVAGDTIVLVMNLSLSN